MKPLILALIVLGQVSIPPIGGTVQKFPGPAADITMLSRIEKGTFSLEMTCVPYVDRVTYELKCEAIKRVDIAPPLSTYMVCVRNDMPASNNFRCVPAQKIRDYVMAQGTVVWPEGQDPATLR